jgi:hypothetical protein
MGEEIDNAMQQAPQEDLQSIEKGVTALRLYGVMGQR